MRRKLIKQGKNALTVTLPAKWVEKNELEGGMEVELEETNNQIHISNSQSKKDTIEKSAIVDITGQGSLIKNVIGAYYKSGYDKIKIKFKSSQEYETLQKLSMYFSGLSIIEESKESIVLGKIASLEDYNVDTLLRRQYFLLEMMTSEIVQALHAKNADKLKLIALKDDDFTRLNDLTRRMTIVNKNSSIGKAAPLFALLYVLEKAADELKEFCLESIKNNKITTKGQIQIIESIYSFTQRLNSFYFDHNLSQLIKIKKDKEKILRNFKQIKDKESNHLIQYVNYLYDSNGLIMQLQLVQD